MRHKFLLFSFIISFACVKTLFAQVIDSTHTHQIKEVEVNAFAKPSASLSSNPLQALTSSDIDRIGVQSISDAVRRFTGVVVKDYGGIGGFKTVSIRGNGAEHTAILYDGMAVSNSQSGQVDIGKFSLENVEMLSLTIGQSDNIFRTAKAIASVGSLDIKTLSPTFVDKNYILQAQIRTGSWGLFNPYMYVAYKTSDKFSFSIDANWQRADGRYSYEWTNVTQSVKAKRSNTDINTKRTELNLFGNLSSSQKLYFKANFYDSERGLPGAFILYNEDQNKERLWDRNFFTQTRYSNKLSNNTEIEIQGKYTHSYMKYIDENDKYDGGKQEDRYDQNEIYLSGMLLHKLNKQVEVSFAEDFSYNSLRANYTGFPRPDRRSSLTAFSAKYESSRLTLVGNILGTYIGEHAKEGATPDDKKRLSPSISMTYKILKNSNLRLRGSYKDVFRVPTFNEMYYYRMGNTALSPEKARQINLGITWSDSFSDIFSYFNITADAYYNKVKDKIIIYPSTYNPKAVNLGRVEIKGIDVNANSTIALSNKIDVQLSASYTYQNAIDITDSEDKNYKEQIPYTPKHSGAASVSIENQWINVGYSFIVSGKTYGGSQNTEYNKIDSYTAHTISANKTFNFKRYVMRLQADITNLTNKTYYIIKDYPMPGRAYRISLNVKF